MPSPPSSAAVILPELRRWQRGEQSWWLRPPRRPQLKIDFTPELTIGQIVRYQRDRALAFVETTGQARAFRLLDDARKSLADKLISAKSGSFTEAKYLANLTQVEAVVRELAQHNFEAFQACSNVYSEMGIADAVAQVRLAERMFTGVSRMIPLKEAAKFVDANMDRRSILRRYQRRMAVYGYDLVDELERTMGTLALSGTPSGEAINALSKKSPIFTDARWKAARIWRTEMADAYESAKMSTAEFMRAEYFEDLKKSLSATFDGRTGDDSRYVHGQKRELDELFEDNRGRRYQKPPNRPNDRETTIFLRDEWEKESE